MLQVPLPSAAFSVDWLWSLNPPSSEQRGSHALVLGKHRELQPEATQRAAYQHPWGDITRARCLPQHRHLVATKSLDPGHLLLLAAPAAPRPGYHGPPGGSACSPMSTGPHGGELPSTRAGSLTLFTGQHSQGVNEVAWAPEAATSTPVFASVGEEGQTCAPG
ncbi:hypothetical protein HaLaN_06405, partial [Haematococcus lacustris]